MRTQTPDTDAIHLSCNGISYCEILAKYNSMLEHARKMEIERNEEKGRANRHKRELEIEEGKCNDLICARNRAQHWEFILSEWGKTPETVSDFIKGQQARIRLLL